MAYFHWRALARGYEATLGHGFPRLALGVFKLRLFVIEFVSVTRKRSQDSLYQIETLSRLSLKGTPVVPQSHQSTDSTIKREHLGPSEPLPRSSSLT